MIKFTILVVAIIVGIISVILNNFKSKKANKLLESGDKDNALLIYKELFVDLFDPSIIDEDGDGLVPSFLHNLRNKGTNYLNKISEILKNDGVSLDISPYEKLIEDVERFSKQKGVMNYKKQPVKEGKKIYAEFYRRIMLFIDSIPDNINHKGETIHEIEQVKEFTD